jgi:hypothetical protein
VELSVEINEKPGTEAAKAVSASDLIFHSGRVPTLPDFNNVTDCRQAFCDGLVTARCSR